MLLAGDYARGVQPLRSALLKHPLLALAIGLAALALRLAVPAGYMPMLDHGRLALTICSGSGTVVAKPPHAAASSTPGALHHENGPSEAQSSCAFADLAFPLIGGADRVQLAAALVFIIATALFIGAALPPPAALRLRPPLRGPPLPN
ncbi:MAG TPA: hypothetical protein VE053_16865 [Allosphingosinicella sp.]|nr:hypothetical protein [Allosphingosinicella sp.]